MPPKKKTAVPASESPVVFCLKTEIAQQQPTAYDEILRTIEYPKMHIDNEMLKSILEKTRTQEPQSTEHVSCFWCCHEFNTPRCVLPISYDTYKNIFIVEGHFCSPECALAYNYGNPLISNSVCWNRHSLLNLLYNQMYTDKTLSPAPPRTLLRMFGGPLNIVQYREYTRTLNNIILATMPPIEHVSPAMNVHGSLNDIKKYVSLDPSVLEKATSDLRIKRSNPKPLTNTLDLCIKK
jgi:hypothetical protein